MRSVATTERDAAKFAQALFLLTRTRNGWVTLTAGVAVTVVYDPTVTEDSEILLVPRTANAAAAKYGTPFCLVTVSRGSFSIAHDNNGQTDRTFRWIAFGD